ncbi:MAG: DinB family protein [Candidatus Hodarchaeota archaeon]
MEKLIQHLKNRRLGIVYILKMVSSELWDWQRSTRMKNIADLVNHLSCVLLAFLELLKGNMPDGKSHTLLEQKYQPQNAQEAVRIYNKSLIQLLNYLEELLEDVYENSIFFFYLDHPSSIFKETFEEIRHEWFHLGQIFTYLRQNNFSVDMGVYYGFKDPNPNIPDE